jgi:hypothetical protein
MRRALISLAVAFAACGAHNPDAGSDALVGRANLLRRVASPPATGEPAVTTSLAPDRAIALRFDDLPGRDPLRVEVIVHRQAGSSPVVFRAWPTHPRQTALVRAPLGATTSTKAEDARIDVTEYVRSAIAQGRSSASLWVDADEDVAIASPTNANREIRPRLDLYTL